MDCSYIDLHYTVNVFHYTYLFFFLHYCGANCGIHVITFSAHNNSFLSPLHADRNAGLVWGRFEKDQSLAFLQFRALQGNFFIKTNRFLFLLLYEGHTKTVFPCLHYLLLLFLSQTGTLQFHTVLYESSSLCLCRHMDEELRDLCR